MGGAAFSNAQMGVRGLESGVWRDAGGMEGGLGSGVRRDTGEVERRVPAARKTVGAEQH